MVLTVAEHQVDVAVSVHIELKYPLQHATARDVQILTRIAECAARKRVEAAGGEVDHVVQGQPSRVGDLGERLQAIPERRNDAARPVNMRFWDSLYSLRQNVRKQNSTMIANTSSRPSAMNTHMTSFDGVPNHP